MDEIEVVYKDGMFGFVDPQELDQLIDSGEIVKFLRGSSWVYPGIDPTRKGSSKPVSWDKRNSDVFLMDRFTNEGLKTDQIG